MYTKKKAIYLGGNIEVIEFQGIIFYGPKPPKRNISQRTKPLTDEERAKNRLKNRQRAKSAFRRLVKCNAFKWFDKTGKVYKPIFITFTFRGSVTQIPKANRKFSKFIQRFNYAFGYDKNKLKYAGTIEFQKDVDFQGKPKPNRGSIHYHVIFFNLPFMERIYDRARKIWGQGAANIKTINDIRGAVIYVTKYMVKGAPDERLEGKKTFFTSKGLFRPITLYDQREVEIVEKKLSLPDSGYKKIEAKPITTETGERILYRIYEKEEP